MQYAYGRRKGFTLIELLVAVAIIAVLAAMLFPIMARVQNSAKLANCASNLKQTGMAVSLYFEANDGSFPPDSHNDNVHLIFKLQKYSGTQLLYRCPADLSRNFETPLPGYRTKRRSSYGSNFYMTPYSPDEAQDGTHGFTRMSLFRSPSKTIYIAEIAKDSITDHFHPAFWDAGTRDPVKDDAMGATLHFGKSNYLFLDGHVDLLLFEQTWNKSAGINLYDPR